MSIHSTVYKAAWRLVPEVAVEKFKHNEQRYLELWEKSANAIGLMTDVLQLRGGDSPVGIPGSPSPLTSMLVGGMAGAGLGYGTGWLLDKVLPEDWKRKRLRKTLALFGGLAGAAPGLTWGVRNLMLDRSFNSPYSIFNPPPPEKQAGYFDNSVTGLSNVRPINVNSFNQTIWNDPNVANRMPASMQAAASGLVTGAANLPGRRNSNLVTFHDIGRLSAGMGVGYAKGALVGKALGLLTGMPDRIQQPIRQLGLYAGVLKEIIPIAYGG